MVCWLLRRWGPISKTLSDMIEDGKMGALQDLQDMRRSVEKPSKGYSISISLGHSLRIRLVVNQTHEAPFRPRKIACLVLVVIRPNIRSFSFHPPPRDESPLKSD
ncbi:hypothetical protein BYT27DRAFT_6854084 [Phlegmacium glaucopus]|nr:hypothetical protein BYT27DRAFT_6854084 [Phlegmacium glaucopus]